MRYRAVASQSSSRRNQIRGAAGVHHTFAQFRGSPSFAPSRSKGFFNNHFSLRLFPVRHRQQQQHSVMQPAEEPTKEGEEVRGMFVMGIIGKMLLPIPLTTIPLTLPSNCRSSLVALRRITRAARGAGRARLA